MNNLEVPVVTPANMPYLGKIKAVLHIAELVMSILTLCTVVPVIATEIRFYGGSQAAPNWTLVVTIVTWWIPLVLFYFPWTYDRHNKFRRIGKFCLKARTNLIFSIFGTVMWAAAAIAMTVHANNPAHCTLDSERASASDGGDYASAWPVQCNCAKAAAAFAWLNCLLWLATLICSIIVAWNEKQLARQNRKQHEEGKLEQTPGNDVAVDEEAAAASFPTHPQQQQQEAKCEVAPTVPYQQQQMPETAQQHQYMPGFIPQSTALPFHHPPGPDAYGMPVPTPTPSLPPPTQAPYNNNVPSYHHYQ